jgi:hypothetical protein
MSRSSEGSGSGVAPNSVLMPPSVSAAPPPAAAGMRTGTLAAPFLGRATAEVRAPATVTAEHAATEPAAVFAPQPA